MMAVRPVGERGLEWIRGGEEGEIVLSSRVRVARNLQGFQFPGRAGAEARERERALRARHRGRPPRGGQEDPR